MAVKLNSADFQKGGFAFEDALTLSKWLEDEGVDLIEVSGGMYEQPKMMGFDGKTLYLGFRIFIFAHFVTYFDTAFAMRIHMP